MRALIDNSELQAIVAIDQKDREVGVANTARLDWAQVAPRDADRVIGCATSWTTGWFAEPPSNLL